MKLEAIHSDSDKFSELKKQQPFSCFISVYPFVAMLKAMHAKDVHTILALFFFFLNVHVFEQSLQRMANILTTTLNLIYL